MVTSGKKLRHDWAGALSDFRDKFTSLELQKKLVSLRGMGRLSVSESELNEAIDRAKKSIFKGI